MTKSIENHLHSKMRLYHFQLKNKISISDHINYTKFLADLANVDKVIKDEGNALIILSSLPDEEYETFVLTLINGKSSHSYNDVSTAIVNHEVRMKDKESSSSSTTTEALTARGIDSNHWKAREILVSPRPVIAN